jgi:hypothetical protein
LETRKNLAVNQKKLHEAITDTPRKKSTKPSLTHTYPEKLHKTITDMHTPRKKPHEPMTDAHIQKNPINPSPMYIQEKPHESIMTHMPEAITVYRFYRENIGYSTSSHL